MYRPTSYSGTAALLGVVVGALTLLAGPVRAQGAPSAAATLAVEAGDAEWALRTGPRLVAALGSPSADVRARALHAVSSLAFADPGGADLRPAVPALLQVARTDSDDRLRIMALTALHASADPDAMAALRGEVGRPASPAVQRALLAVLVDHYGTDAFRGDAEVAALAQSLLDHDRRVARSARGGRLVAAR